MSDIIVMAKKEFEGKVLKDDGEISSTGEICAVTPASGKTFYLARAWANQVTGSTVSTDRIEVDLENDGTKIDTVRTMGADGKMEYPSTLIGESLDGDGAKKFRWNVTGNPNSNTIFGAIWGFIEDDADDPFQDFR